MPVTTRSLRVVDSFGLDKLRFEDIELPDPGPGELLIRIRAASLNYRDLLVAKGLYNPRLAMPRTLGSDAAGQVVAIGPGVTRFAAGDRVCGLFFQQWSTGPLPQDAMRHALGESIDGIFTTYRVLPESGVIATPAYLSDEEAATLPCAAVTAWHALIADGNLQPGETVLVLGTGGVSLFALQIAKLHGARVIVTSSSDDKLQRARTLGADLLINYKTHPDWEKEVVRLNGGKGVDHVIEVGGPGTLPRSCKAARVGGKVHLIGVLTQTEGGGTDLMPVLMRGLHLQGILVGSEAMFTEMNRAFETAALRPVIDRVYPFAEAVTALHSMESASHFGKLVLRID